MPERMLGEEAGPGRDGRFLLARSAAAVLAAAGLALLAAGPAAAGSKLSGTDAMIARHAGRSGGARVEQGGVALHSSLGEAGIQASAGGQVRLRTGLMPMISQPGSVVAITAVSKSTGTLELSWTAPGLDGFQGSVVSGFYRVDYSSEADHSFAPTTYRLEFSTTVSPGNPQSLTLAGLEPNTTYYTRIYLADPAKVFAEDCRRSDEATLAGAPIAPAVVDVSSNYVTLSWVVPVGGAGGGYRGEASTTSFGSLLPGGAVVSGQTPDGLQVTMTISGLDGDTTYYFKVASLNWQGDKNFTSVLSAATLLSGLPVAVRGMGGSQDALRRTVSFSWVNPRYLAPAGVLVVQSTSPAASEVADGLDFSPGQVLADGSVVRSTAIAASFEDSGLVLDATYYYHIFSEGQGLFYSVSVSTAVFLDLPPMAPAGFAGLASPDRGRVTLSWNPVASNNDGSAYASTAAPRAVELSAYEVQRATSVLRPAFVKLATVPADATSYTDVVPDPARSYLYRVRSVDSFDTGDLGMAVASDGDLFVFAADAVTHLRVPRALVPQLRRENNAHGADVLLRAVDEPPDAEQKAFRSVRFEARSSPAGAAVSPFQFSDPGLTVSMRYEVAGGRIVASGPGALGSFPNISPAEAGRNLGVYWHNGSKYVKLFGRVDPFEQTVSIQTALTGSYQVRALAREQGFTFDVSTLSNKLITPNNDGLNDRAVFVFDNPKDSAFSGRILDLRGMAVADMAPGPVPNRSLQWDGRAGGRPVSGGIYVYQIRAEEKVFTGTLLVVR